MTHEQTMLFADLDADEQSERTPVIIPATMEGLKTRIHDIVCAVPYGDDIAKRIAERNITLRAQEGKGYRVGVPGFGNFGYIDRLPTDYKEPEEA